MKTLILTILFSTLSLSAFAAEHLTCVGKRFTKIDASGPFSQIDLVIDGANFSGQFLTSEGWVRESGTVCKNQEGKTEILLDYDLSREGGYSIDIVFDGPQTIGHGYLYNDGFDPIDFDIDYQCK